MASPSSSQREVESIRYRLQLILTETRIEADRKHDEAIVGEARALEARLFDIPEAENAEEARAALTALDSMRPAVEELAARAGLDLGGREPTPKWRRLAKWAGPGLLVLLVVLIVFERRRKKVQISAEAMARLDEADAESERAAEARESTLPMS